jgi:hypothetical protein
MQGIRVWNKQKWQHKKTNMLQSYISNIGVKNNRSEKEEREFIPS